MNFRQNIKNGKINNLTFGELKNSSNIQPYRRGMQYGPVGIRQAQIAVDSNGKVQLKPESQSSSVATRDSSENQAGGEVSIVFPIDFNPNTRYQLKYQIENHSEYGTNLAQGPLQRDEKHLQTMKKVQQSQELKEALSRQIEEKRMRSRTVENSPAVPGKSVPISPLKATENIKFQRSFEIQPAVPKRFMSVPPEGEHEITYLRDVCQQLAQEQASLRNQIQSQQGIIEELKRRQSAPDPSSKLKPAFNQRQVKSRIDRPRIRAHFGKISSPVPKAKAIEKNLDSVGQSQFIFPNQNGSFNDELDKFISASPYLPIKQSNAEAYDRPSPARSKFPRDFFTTFDRHQQYNKYEVLSQAANNMILQDQQQQLPQMKSVYRNVLKDCEIQAEIIQMKRFPPNWEC